MKIFIVGFFIISLPFLFFQSPSQVQDEYSINFPPPRFATKTDEAVDADSDIDSSANIGTNNSDYTNAQTVNSVYQNITEENTASGAGTLKAFAQSNSFLSAVCVSGLNNIHGAPDQVYADCNKGDDIYSNSYNTSTGAILQVYFNITYYGTVSGTLDWYYQLDAGGFVLIKSLTEGGTSGSPLTDTYNATSLRGTWTWANINDTDIQFDNNDAGGPETAYVDALYMTVVLDASANYRLDWEHQATSLPAGTGDTYNLTIKGQSTENIEVYLWNTSSLSWNDTAVGNVSSSFQWYNWTITGNFLTGSTMTWRYLDTNTTGDSSSQDILTIDYAGVFVWSLNVTINQIPNATGIPNAGDTEFDSFPINFTIDAGADFDLEIKCTEGNGSVCSGNWLFWDTDNNPSGYTQLTTAYQTAYSDQSYTITNLDIWLWVVVPNGEVRAPYSWTLDVRIIVS